MSGNTNQKLTSSLSQSLADSRRGFMDPWEENMVTGLRQQIKDLKAENEKLKQESKLLQEIGKQNGIAPR